MEVLWGNHEGKPQKRGIKREIRGIKKDHGRIIHHDLLRKESDRPRGRIRGLKHYVFIEVKVYEYK